MRWIFATKLRHSTTVTCTDGHGWPRRAGLDTSGLLARHGSGAAIELEAPQVKACGYLRSGWHRTPGIGKTRMLRELAARAEASGHLVLAGAASELERDVPFSVFVARWMSTSRAWSRKSSTAAPITLRN